MAESGRWPGGSTAPLVPLLPRTRGHLTIRLKGQASQGAAKGLGPSHANRSDGKEATETLGRQAASERRERRKRVWPREAGSGPRTGVWCPPAPPQFSSILMLSTKKKSEFKPKCGSRRVAAALFRSAEPKPGRAAHTSLHTRACTRSTAGAAEGGRNVTHEDVQRPRLNF